MRTPAIIIFDIGKTNKKLFVFDESYQVLREESVQLKETVDEDGFPCEDLVLLSRWIKDQLQDCLHDDRYQVMATNVAAYGASFVYLDADHQPLDGICNYLKPYPGALQERFFDQYGGRDAVCLETCSPALGSLNSGLQVYRMKYERPAVFAQVAAALHLPQYLSFLITGLCYTDWSSVGCHTMLWNFGDGSYHRWVAAEGMLRIFPALTNGGHVTWSSPYSLHAGIGIHDSSAALIPYLRLIQQQFVLISTGTWCISLNPFDHLPLTIEELENDCLCYLGIDGRPVKASRLFMGFEHDEGVGRIADHFHCDPLKFRSLTFEPVLLQQAAARPDAAADPHLSPGLFSSAEEAYHALIFRLVTKQVASTGRILTPGIKTVFVDGGFSKNHVYMNMLASMLPDHAILAASVPQATAVGAAMAIHTNWNRTTLPGSLLQFSKYIASTYPQINPSTK